MSTIIDIARMYAHDKHNGQLDDSGLPYCVHLAQTVSILSQVTQDQEILAAGYLHDTLEDTTTTLYDLYRVFGPRIAGLVYEVTHEGTKKTGHYFPRLKSRDAILVKYADRLSNLSRMEPWDEKRKAQYLKRARFWANMKVVLDNHNTTMIQYN